MFIRTVSSIPTSPTLIFVPIDLQKFYRLRFGKNLSFCLETSKQFYEWKRKTDLLFFFCYRSSGHKFPMQVCAVVLLITYPLHVIDFGIFSIACFAYDFRKGNGHLCCQVKQREA